MLKRIGLQRCAYDWRAEHVPQFEDEIQQYRKHGIEFFAFWDVHDDALRLFEKYDLHPQIWKTAPSPDAATQADKVSAAVRTMEPLARRTKQLGCSLGLYNHGGWGGEPRNLVAVCQGLRDLGYDHVGIVYNWHHGHEHIDDWAESLRILRPYLLCLNLNGMNANANPKILPLGAGQHDLSMLKTLVDSGYTGPIGILNHTDLDAEARLRDNLDGLQWLTKQLDGTPAAPRPQFRTFSAATQSRTQPLAGMFAGKVFEGRPEYRQPPITVECVATLTQKRTYNILVANDTKRSTDHWEIFSMTGNGYFTAYLPGRTPDHVRSSVDICDGHPHHLAMSIQSDRVRLYVDGREVANQAIRSGGSSPVPGGLAVGRLVEGGIGCHGSIEWVRVSRGVREIPKDLPSKVDRDQHTLALWTFAAGEHSSHAAHEHHNSANAPPAAAPPFDPEFANTMAGTATEHGSAERGLAVFAAHKSACLSCHKIGQHGGTVGPELTKIAHDRTAQQIVESVFWPKRDVKPEFRVTAAVTEDGRVHRGYKIASSESSLTLKEPATGELIVLDRQQIEEEIDQGTLMPDGLTAAMSREQQVDLIRFLTTLGRPEGLAEPLIDAVVAHAHAHVPAAFEFDRAPLDPRSWPSWEHPVNRDRVYDFYGKQAEYFRRQLPRPSLLSEFPGLDGGQFGHWGNQNDTTWAGDEWNQMRLGSVQSGIFHGGGVTVARGVCVRLGETSELSACFNPDTLSYDAVWSGGFVKFSSFRHGFLHGLIMEGQLRAKPEAKKPSQPHKYLGFYRHGKRVVFAYRIGDVEYLDAPWVENGEFAREVAPVETHPLREVVQGGPSQWPQSLDTKIVYGEGHPYAIDTVELPVDNPWNAPLFCGGHDFLPDGSALVCTMQGDVWHVSGFVGNGRPDRPTQATWRRFASGLHHALGLLVTDRGIFVQCRDQLVRLHDRNGDGEADFYECFSNAFVTSAAGHDFICGLQQDQQGNFYTASGNQGLLRISADGERADVIATGFRNPDGVGLHPAGWLTTPCSEGDWTPSSMICEVPLAAGADGVIPHYGYRGPRDSQAPTLPLAYLPRGLDNSSGGQVYVSSERWGPLHGQMIHLSFGAGAHYLLLRDLVDGQSQGAIVPLPGEFKSGVHRGRFNPRDGQLYVSGMSGWGTYTTDQGCFQRVRYTGDSVQLPIGFHVHQNGVAVRFSEPLKRETAETASNHFAQCWNYQYSGAYGSPEYATRHPGLRGHDVLAIRSAHVLNDQHTLFLDIPDLQPVNQLHLRLNVASVAELSSGENNGSANGVDMFVTVHRLDEPLAEFPGYVHEPKTILPHPILSDLALATKRVPNPWQRRVPDARPLRLETGKNLTFATRTLRVKAGEALQFTLANPDVVPHNWVLVKPGSLRSVGEASNQLVADPEAFARHYIPHSDEVLFHTDIVPPGSEFTIYFRAPKEPGVYPYLCTFPGHWMVMNGELIVESDMP
ncbi:MAG: hypothetical protein KDA62_02030 [Planctomycetales bacterium]|nr:hypothetical protein [Planctomycetales bacterium]